MRIEPGSMHCGCNICGGLATAMWWGDCTTYLCAHCAIEALPALIADAVAFTPTRDPRQVLDRVSENYYKAVSLRLHREKLANTPWGPTEANLDCCGRCDDDADADDIDAELAAASRFFKEDNRRRAADTRDASTPPVEDSPEDCEVA